MRVRAFGKVVAATLGALLGVGMVVLPCAGCLSWNGDALEMSPPASGVRVGKVEDALAQEQAERQSEDARLLDSQAKGDAAGLAAVTQAAADLRAGLDPSQALAKLSAEQREAAARLASDLDARAKTQETALRDAIRDARTGDVNWLEVLGISAGVMGAGAGGAAVMRRKGRVTAFTSGGSGTWVVPPGSAGGAATTASLG